MNIRSISVLCLCLLLVGCAGEAPGPTLSVEAGASEVSACFSGLATVAYVGTDIVGDELCHLYWAGYRGIAATQAAVGCTSGAVFLRDYPGDSSFVTAEQYAIPTALPHNGGTAVVDFRPAGFATGVDTIYFAGLANLPALGEQGEGQATYHTDRGELTLTVARNTGSPEPVGESGGATCQIAVRWEGGIPTLEALTLLPHTDPETGVVDTFEIDEASALSISQRLRELFLDFRARYELCGGQEPPSPHAVTQPLATRG